MSYVIIDRFNSGKASPNPVVKIGKRGPPDFPEEGSRVIVGTGAGTSVWTGEEGSIAEFRDGAWEFTSAVRGDQIFVNSENLNFTFDGTEWIGRSQAASVKATGVAREPMTEEDMVIVGGAATGEYAEFASGDLVVVTGLEFQVEPATTVNEPDLSPAGGDKHIVGAVPAGDFASFAVGSVATFDALASGWFETVVATENVPRLILEEGASVLVDGSGSGEFIGLDGFLLTMVDGASELVSLPTGTSLWDEDGETLITNKGGGDWQDPVEEGAVITSVEKTVERTPMAVGDRVLAGAALEGDYSGFSTGELITAGVAGFVSEAVTTLDDPPGSPSDGDVTMVGASPTGIFVGKTGKLAEYEVLLYPPYSRWKFEDIQTENAPRTILLTGESVLIDGSVTGEFTGQGGQVGSMKPNGDLLVREMPDGTSLYHKGDGVRITRKGQDDWEDPVEEASTPASVKTTVATEPVTEGDMAIVGPSATAEFTAFSAGELATVVGGVYVAEAIATENAPVGGPVDGDKYVVGAAPTGDFSGKTPGDVTIYADATSTWNDTTVATEDDPRTILEIGESVLIDGIGSGEYSGEGGKIGTMKSDGTVDVKEMPVGTSVYHEDEGVRLTRKGPDNWSDPTALNSQDKSEAELTAAQGATLLVEVSDGEDITLDMAAGESGEVTLDIGGMVAGKTYNLTVDNTGSTMTLAYGPEFKFEGGTPPTLSGATDKFTLTTDGADIYVSIIGLNFS